MGVPFFYPYRHRLLPALRPAALLVNREFTAEIMPLAEAIGLVVTTLAGMGLGASSLRQLAFSNCFEHLRYVALLRCRSLAGFVGLSACCRG